MDCPASEYAKYKTMQSIDCRCYATKECEITSCVHAGIQPCHGNTIQHLFTSTCAFVANKVFKCILLNTTTEIEVLKFYYINKRKIN